MLKSICLALGLLAATGNAMSQDAAPPDPTIECLKALNSDARFAPLAGKMAIADGRDTTFEMMANQTLATKKEQTAVAELIAARKECVKAGEAFHQKTYPSQVVAVLLESEDKLAILAVDLFNRKATFGAFNQRRIALVDEIRNKITAVVQDIQAQRAAQKQAQEQQTKAAQAAAQQRAAAEQQAALDRAQRDEQARMALEQQADLARRQMAAQILLGTMRAGPVYQAPPPIQPYQIPVRPTINTNCSTYGNQTNCTSR